MKITLDDDEKSLRTMSIIFMVIIGIGVVIEVGVLAAAYFMADEVTCNMGWCEFKTTRREVSMESHSSCFQNGERINCSDIDFPSIEEKWKR